MGTDNTYLWMCPDCHEIETRTAGASYSHVCKAAPVKVPQRTEDLPGVDHTKNAEEIRTEIPSGEKVSDGPRIMFGVPFLTPHRKHMRHVVEWYALNKIRHNIRFEWIFYQSLHRAQRTILDLAREIGASHILFSEHDHWGYPLNGLDVLLEADKDVIGFRTYFKTYPFLSMAFRKRDPSKNMVTDHPGYRKIEDKADQVQFEQIEGVMGDPVQKVDLLSWAFTLVKLSVFDRMDAAGKDPFRQWGPVPTDSFFCQYCEDLGIDRWVHFGFTIGHGDVSPHMIHLERRFVEVKQQHLKVLKGQKVQLEDDYGHVYGETEYVSEQEWTLAAFQQGEQYGKANGETGHKESPDAQVKECTPASPPGPGTPGIDAGISVDSPGTSGAR